MSTLSLDSWPVNSTLWIGKLGSDHEYPAPKQLAARWRRRFLYWEQEYQAIKDADCLAPIYGKRCAPGIYQLPFTLLRKPAP